MQAKETAMTTHETGASTVVWGVGTVLAQVA